MEWVWQFLSIIHASTSQNSLDLESDMLREFAAEKCTKTETTESGRTCAVYSNDTLAAPFKPVQSDIWKTYWGCAAAQEVDLSISWSLRCRYTCICLHHIVSQALLFILCRSLMCKKFSSIRIDSKHFVSNFRHKKVNYCYILASWVNTDGAININSFVLRPGAILGTFYTCYWKPTANHRTDFRCCPVVYISLQG